MRQLTYYLLGGILLGACGSAAPDSDNDSGNDDGNGNDPDRYSSTFECDSSALPFSLPLRRLSNVQYRNTISDLLTYANADSAPQMYESLETVLQFLPNDVRSGPENSFALFSRLDQSIQQDHIDGSYRVAKEAALQLTANPQRLATLVGDCDAESVGCMQDFVARFGQRVIRRPLSEEDIAFYSEPAGTAPFDAEDYQDVLTLLLTSPNLMYQVEHGVDGSNDTRAALSDFEIASRLSYQFWQTMPDEELFAAASAGELSTEDGYKTQLDRVLEDPRSVRGISEFISQWLENPRLQELDARVGTPVYDAVRDGFEPEAELKGRMQQEIIDSAIYYMKNGGSFQDFFTSNKSFAKDSDLAEIYGVEVWDGQSEPPMMTEPERAGLLTRAGLLATGFPGTRPIIKGVYIRKSLLCDNLPPPPPNAPTEPPLAGDNASTRDNVDALTGVGVCAGCHVTQINPLGFATENFDAFGRLRPEELIFDENGETVGSAAIDTNVVPLVDISDTREASGAADLSAMIVESPKATACFARQYFRFTYGRTEHTAKDGCALLAVKEVLDEKRSLRDVLRAIALQDEFRRRTF